jgi:nicotinate-nucleotide pyrophosphorylase (carboxylating)
VIHAKTTVPDTVFFLDWAALLRLAIDEDLGTAGDLTTLALVGDDAVGRAGVVARQAGVVAGLPGVEMTLAAMDSRLRWLPHTEDGRAVVAGECVGVIEGPARGLLAAERILLNFLGRLSGIATLTRQYVDAAGGVRVYDTRKTTPGWRRLEKYAVRCGGGHNHRGGLDEAVLIKDNHLAVGAAKGTVPFSLRENRDSPHVGSERDSPIFAHAKIGTVPGQFSAAEAVERARQFVGNRGTIVEVEVDTLEQLDAVLPARPDIVLLDNMDPAQLRQAVARRNAVDPSIELEASGGITLETIGAIAAAGVDRISVGALTHSAVALDLGLDWGR